MELQETLGDKLLPEPHGAQSPFPVPLLSFQTASLYSPLMRSSQLRESSWLHRP